MTSPHPLIFRSHDEGEQDGVIDRKRRRSASSEYLVRTSAPGLAAADSARPSPSRQIGGVVSPVSTPHPPNELDSE
jgi:hypothetical protein